MKVLGYNPHVAIRIALAGNAVDMISIMIRPCEGVSSYPKSNDLFSIRQVYPGVFQVGDRKRRPETRNIGHDCVCSETGRTIRIKPRAGAPESMVCA